MNKSILSVSMFFCLVFFSIQATAQLTDQQQRIKASYILSFGRDASSGEVTYWQGRGALSISQLITYHKQYIMQDATTHSTLISRAYMDAIGRAATSSEINYWKVGNDTYTTLMKNHLNWLKGNPSEYDKVIKNSYLYVFGRQPSAGELTYWKSQAVVSYVILVGYHQDYKKRNAVESGTTYTFNTSNAPAMITVPLSLAIATEARNASGIVAAGGGNIIAAGGGNIVAAGGGNIVAAGGGNIVAAGGGN
ncbi:hypothetical protein BH09BAC2_BH09BAC2_06070 [soil metagenome]